MKTILAFMILILASCNLTGQILLNRSEQINSISLKAGWDQTIAIGINYSHSCNSLFNDKPTNLQIEFLSPFATFHKLNNGRISLGIQNEIFKKNHFGLIINVFGTYSWTKDVTASISGIGLYASVLPAYITDNDWILSVEFAYRPTLFEHFNFSETYNDTFKDRYPENDRDDNLPERDGWYSFTNNKFQVGLIVNKKFNPKFQLGLKLGFEHYFNDHNILMNGWIGQVPLNANINFTYCF